MLMQVTKDDLSNNPALQETMVQILTDRGVDPYEVSIEEPSWFFEGKDGDLRLSYPRVMSHPSDDGSVVACFRCNTVITEREVVAL